MANDIKRVDSGETVYCRDARLLDSAKRQAAGPSALALLAYRCPPADTRVNASAAPTRGHLRAARILLSARRFSGAAEANSAETELPNFTVPLARIMNKYREDKPLHQIAVECERLLIKPALPDPQAQASRADASEALSHRADLLAELFERCSMAQDGSGEARELLDMIRRMYRHRTDGAGAGRGIQVDLFTGYES